MNQYIVYTLTRQVTLAYTVQAVPEQAVSQKQASYTALLQSLGQASLEEIRAALAERDEVEPEEGLTVKINQPVLPLSWDADERGGCEQ